MGPAADEVPDGLEQAADALYAEPPAAFTAARAARAAAARESGNRPLAQAVSKLRRPTVGAWLVNLLARSRAEQVGELLELGAELRAAQGSLAADELRRLSPRRHELLGALTAAGRQLAEERGMTASAPALDELRSTLEAAVADPDAAAAVRRGCLDRPLRYAGLGLEALSGDVRRPAPSSRSRSSRRREATAAPDENRRRVAEARVAEFARHVEERGQRRDEVADELRRVRTELAGAEARLAGLRQREGEVAKRLERARAEHRDAERALRRAESDLGKLPPT
jgi:hypothetical protein